MSTPATEVAPETGRVQVRPALQPPGTPHRRVPSGAWDTHAHVFGPAALFPQAPERRYDAPTQPTELYTAMLDTLGVSYGVLVQPSVYGNDNSCLLDALDREPRRFVGVLDIDLARADVDDLAELSRRGVCGIRVAWSPSRPVDRLAKEAAVLNDLNWHLDIRVDHIAELTQLAPQLAELRVPVMVESMGSPTAGESLDSPGALALLELLSTPEVYVKLSHPYQIDPAGPPYAGTVAFARWLLSHAPDRAVWGSDWPHPMLSDAPLPDEGTLLDLLDQWAGSPELADRVLRDNASRFYTPLGERRITSSAPNQE